jgi:hypothetical protein
MHYQPRSQNRSPPAPRLGARTALSVAFKLGLRILAAGPAPLPTVLLFQSSGTDFVAIATILLRPVLVTPRLTTPRDRASGVGDASQQLHRLVEDSEFDRIELALQYVGEPGLSAGTGHPQEIEPGGGQVDERAAAVARVRAP